MNALTSANTPVNQYNRTAYFYPSGLSPSWLGRILKQANEAILVRLDYTQGEGSTVNITSWSFQVDVGSNPPLAINAAMAVAAPGVSTFGGLQFILSGGIEGQRYIVSVTVSGSIDRTDQLEIDVPLGDCSCAAAWQSGSGDNNASYPTGNAYVYINSAPKYIVSVVTPSSANVMDQWFDPATNELAEYVTDGTNYWWQTMVTTAPSAPTTFVTKRMSPIPVNGTQTTFTMHAEDGSTVNILTTTDLLVSVDGVWQEPEAQYIAWSNQIQFVQAPSADSHVFLIWFEH